MKYIDAEKLIANLRRQKRELELSIQSQGDYGQSCQIVAYENILSLITSLQQEQPKNADSIPADCASSAKCENEHNDPGDFVFELRQIISRHWYADMYGECIDDEEGMAKEILSLCRKLEQPEVDLDNLTIMKEIKKCGCNPNEFDIARHFYELGKGGIV